MKSFLKFISLFVMSIFLMSLFTFAFAQSAPMSNVDFMQLLIASLGGLKGAKALVVAGVIVKLLLAFLDSELSGSILKNVKGGEKLSIVLLLTYLAGLIALMTSGLSFGAAFMHSTSLSAFAVFLNQLYKQFIEKK